jgi:hypothetical protein
MGDNLAELTCTIKEYKKYIGPRIRNIVQSKTKKTKKELSSKCQICGEKAELHAAHIKGMSRNDIIENVLSKYYLPGEITIKIDLEKVEKEIIDAHTPIDKYLLFLCEKCHQRYDKES